MRKQAQHVVADNAARGAMETGLKVSIAAGLDRSCIRIITLCAYCKRFKHNNGTWLPLSELMAWDVDVKFSHGICPDCAQNLYPELYEAVRLKRAVS